MLFATLVWQHGFAQTFNFDGIKYIVKSSTTAEVTTQFGQATGSVIIPAQVSYNNVTYSVTSIGESAFYYSSNLTSVTIPNSVNIIGNEAFMYCSGLTSFIIPNTVTNIGINAFQNCTNLTSVTIPNSIPNISHGLFANCYGLTSVTIPNSVISINVAAFFNCISLTSITIPNSVTDINPNAFDGCTGLTSVTVEWSTPLLTSYTAFQNVNTPTVVLNVPNGTASLYEATSVWTDFIITEALGVTPFSATNAFDLIAYPNPSNNVFNFKIKGANDETVSLLVFDMMGRQIENKVINAIDVKNITLGQNYSSGIYNVIVAQGGNTKSIRLVKE